LQFANKMSFFHKWGRFALFLVCACPLSAAGSVDWTEVFTSGPASRTDTAMVYDSLHHQVLLFGGLSSTAVTTNDTWVWDGNSWTQLYPVTSPPVRGGHALAYDSVRQQVVLFGGYDSSFNPLGDTWVWDGTNWAQKFPATVPTAREYHAMAFDATHSNVLMFGGEDPSFSDLGDTWTWDGTNWTMRTQPGGNTPDPRDSMGMVYDSTNGQVVLFGGTEFKEFGSQETWIWNGTAWNQKLTTHSPPSRGGLGMVFDSARGLTVMFGGIDFEEEGTPLSDTWYFDNTDWTQATTPDSPDARAQPAMAFDALHSQTVLFGGQGNGGQRNDTWLLSQLAVSPTTLPDATQGRNYNVSVSAVGGQSPYLFTVTGLPPGLSVNSLNMIVGQCTAESPSGVTISVTDGESPTPGTASVGPLPLHCNPAPQITNTSPLLPGTTGTPYSATFTTNALFDPPGAAPFTWTLTQGTLPSGFTVSSSGVLTGTAVTSQMYSFSVTFTDRWGATTTKAFQVTFDSPITITTSSLPPGTAGTVYPSTAIGASGGTGSGTYSFAATGLPSGLSINSTSGVISGTPTQSGSFTPSITVSDPDGQMTQASIPLTISPSAAISITTASPLPNGHATVAYSAQIQWTGGVSPFTVSGTGLPSWLTVSAAGLLSGTPPAAGPFTFSVTIADSQTPTQNSTSKSFSLTVTAPAITNTSPLPSATIGVAYSDTFTATGGSPPYTWSSGNLPGWLTLSSAGVLSGTPPTGTMGPVSLNIQVTDSLGGSVTGVFSLPIITPAALMFITTSPLTPATAGSPYSLTVSVSGGVSPYTFTATGLPAWLTLSSGGGLSGTPPSAGPVTFSMTATDSASNHVTQNFTLPVDAVLTIGSTSPLPPATVGVSYSDTLMASGGSGTYTWSATGLPSWLLLSPQGVLTGTPPSTVPVSFIVQVVDGSTSASQMFTLPVNAALTIGTTSPLSPATLNAPYMATFSASGGAGGYTWSATGLPSGFTMSPAGVLTGTPVNTTPIGFSVTVTDSASNTVTQPFTLPVNAALTITNTSPLPPATVGSAYTANFTASGGSGGYSWSASGLPSWLTLTAAGFLSGNPPTASPVAFQVTVTDSQSHTFTGSFNLPVNATLVIGTTSPLVAATVGAPYSLQLTASGGAGPYTWASSTLPSWLILTAGGLLSGTPPTAGPVTFSVTVTDTLSNTASQSLTLPVNSALTITNTSPLNPATVGVTYSVQFSASGGTGMYTWTATSLPSWLTLTASGFLTGTPPDSGAASISVTVTDSLSNSKAGTFTLPVNAALTIGNTSPLPGATPGEAYSLQFNASGGTGPYTWSASSLPSWLTLNSAGFLSGTPPSAGPVSFSVTVTDSGSHMATGTFTLPVNAALTIDNTSPLPQGLMGSAYVLQFTASGGTGPFTWTGSSLPSWLTLTTNGFLSGTPPAAGTFTFSVTVMDSLSHTATANFTLPVVAALAITNTSPLPAGTTGSPYSQQFLASGGTAPYSWTSSNLPGWLTLTAAGLLQGTPPTAGPFTFAVTVTDASSHSTTVSFMLPVNSALSIGNTSPLAAGTPGSPYSLQFVASGGTAPYTWTVTSLPSWLTLSASGLLQGTPPSAGSFTFAVTVTDASSHSTTVSFMLPVNSALSIGNTSPLAAGTTGSPYSLQFVASGGTAPYTWTASSLPSWLTLSASGLLQGTPPNAGSFTFAVTVTDASSHSTTVSFTLPVNSALSIGNTSPLAAGTPGSPYSLQFVASGGTAPYTWTATSLPSWLSLSASGLLQGTPPSAGSFTFAVTVTDASSHSTTVSFMLPVNSALSIGNTSPLAAGTTGSPYSLQFTASGGSAPYTWTATSLPSWLTLSASGLLQGTPPNAGSFNFSVTVTDSLSHTSSVAFTLPVNSTVTISNPSTLPGATVSTSYSLQFAASGGTTPYTWSATSLPSWLTLSAGGALSGTPPVTGPVSFSVTVTDSLSHTSTRSFTLAVNAGVTIDNASPLPGATVGTLFSQQFTASGGTAPYTWAASSLPSWLTITAAGLLSGTPPAGGSFTFAITVTDSGSHSATSSFVLPVNSAITIGNTSPLPGATVGASYSLQFTASGGNGSYLWTATALPSWLTITPAGLLVGTPASAGPVNFSVTVTDSETHSATASFVLPVSLQLTIGNSSPLPPATTGVPYSAQFTASGGTTPYNWTAAGLPSWLTLTSSGIFQGTPPNSGTIAFSVTVRDALNSTQTGNFTLLVNSHVTINTTSPLTSGIVGLPYMVTLSASGGSGSYSWTASGLPSWLTITTAGVLSGVPPSAQNFSFLVIVTDSLGSTASSNLTILVSSSVTILTGSLGVIEVATPLVTQLAATGGSGTYIWNAPNPPAGFTLSQSGVFSGSPPAAGLFLFVVTAGDVNNPQNIATKTLSLSVVPPPNPVTITTGSPLTAATVGVAYMQQFSATAGSGSFSWTAANLPASLTLDSHGLLRGTPTTAGTILFTVTVVDTQTRQTDSEVFALPIYPQLTISTTTLTPAAVGQNYSMQLAAAGGSGRYAWTGSGLPSWLIISSNGFLTGQAPVAGVFNFTVTVTDSVGNSASKQVTLQATGNLTVSTASLPDATVNSAYSVALNATGGLTPYAWNATGLPPGLAISVAGAINGTPTTAGVFNIAAIVTDSASTTATKQFSLQVSTGVSLSISSTTLAPCVIGAACNVSLTATGGVPPYSFALLSSSVSGVSLSPGGVITGNFSDPGVITLLVQLTDAAHTKLTQSIPLRIVSPLVLTVPASATAVVGTNFSLTPTVTQGAAPYVWAIRSGSLPPGITLSSTTGAVTGVPSTAGSYSFTLQVSDPTGTTAQAAITITVNPPSLSIQTSALAAGAAGSPYSQAFQAVNATGAVTWSLLSGTLPSGLSLSPTGFLTGTPILAGDFTFTLQVADSTGLTAIQTYLLHIGPPAQLPPAIAVSLAASVNAGDQPSITVTLASPYSLPILVTATLQLAPNPGGPTDLLFSNGSPTIQFTIPANSTNVSIPFQAGTLAGTIQIVLSLQSAGVDVTPSPAPTATTQIANAAPVLRNVSASLVSGGFQLNVTGLSNTRDVKSVTLHFTAAAGATLQSADATLDVTSLFTQYYQSASSLPTGSQFSLTIPISVSGDVSTIASVSVTMTNSVGVSNSVTANIR
jgi:large repetitive protein